MRAYPTDFRLWGLIFGCLFSPLAGWMLLEPIGRVERVVEEVTILAVACGAVGWVLHAIAVVCGVRLTGSADPAQTADHDEPPSPPPAP